MIKPGQIYFFPKAKVGRSEYPRPGIVLRVSALDATVCFFSTKFELMEPDAVVIEKTDADFQATGLKDSSYLVAKAIGDVPLGFFTGARLLGRAVGDFKKRIEKWYGLPLI